MSDMIYVIMEHGSLKVAGYVTTEEEAKNYCIEHDNYFYFPVNKINIKMYSKCEKKNKNEDKDYLDICIEAAENFNKDFKGYFD